MADASTDKLVESIIDPSWSDPGSPQPYQVSDGFDLVLSQTRLHQQIEAVERHIRTIEQNANLSDTEKMFNMQMGMNTWVTLTNLRTSVLKAVSDTLKTIVRNVA